MMRWIFCLCLALAASRAQPASECSVTPGADISSLRIFTGAAPISWTFACGTRPGGGCVKGQLTPGSQELPSTAVAAFGHEQDGWACIFFSGVTGWVPSNRLAALPDEPAVPLDDWLGWYRRPEEAPGRKNDRLLLTRGKAAGTISVSGRAYWYGQADNIHAGQINAEAKPFGRYLHVIDGESDSACVVNLVADPAKHELIGDDNSQCGGLNVRFWGEWIRFTPSRRGAH